MIVRMSGPASFQILNSFLPHPVKLVAGSVSRLPIRCDGIEFLAWVYAFRKPHSATGEDSIELHIPGNPILARIVLKSMIAGGARSADAGEFTARAFFNGRLDLAAAEGVAAVIAAQNAQELSAARQLMSGELSRRLQPVLDELAGTLALLETGIDFAEEEITTLPRNVLLQRAEQADARLEQLLRESGRFSKITHEPTVVLVGRPNAGKSSLLNALAGHERAVVSPTAGTTRDALSATVRLKRGFVRMIDIPGFEDSNLADEISYAVAATARRAIEAADIIVLVRDIRDRRVDPPIPSRPHLIVPTKVDLVSQKTNEFAVSVVNRVGIDELLERLDDLSFTRSQGASVTLNARHEQAIVAARTALGRVLQSGETADEINALELREALDALGSILGEVTPDAILGKIFSTFCIGK